MKTCLAIALILFVISIVIQFLIKDMPLSSRVGYILEELSEAMAVLATFCFVVSMAWAIALY